jgi:hypothetical protein
LLSYAFYHHPYAENNFSSWIAIFDIGDFMAYQLDDAAVGVPHGNVNFNY